MTNCSMVHGEFDVLVGDIKTKDSEPTQFEYQRNTVIKRYNDNDNNNYV